MIKFLSSSLSVLVILFVAGSFLIAAHSGGGGSIFDTGPDFVVKVTPALEDGKLLKGLTIISNDQRTIKVDKIIINNRCEVTKELVYYKKPLRLGDTIELSPISVLYLNCGDILKVEIDTDQGDSIYTFGAS